LKPGIPEIRVRVSEKLANADAVAPPKDDDREVALTKAPSDPGAADARALALAKLSAEPAVRCVDGVLTNTPVF